MPKPKIAVFSGPTATATNSPTLITSNKARLPGEEKIPGQYDPLVPQTLYEPVKVRIRKFSAHPLEHDASEQYFDDGKDYYEVTLSPDDGPFLLPYMARRADGSRQGRPFETGDLFNPEINYGGRQFFYPDASRVFMEIDRTIGGRTEDGMGNHLSLKADFDFIRALPSGGFTKKGEISGIHYFPYKPYPIGKRARVGDLAKIINIVQKNLSSGVYDGGIWFDGSPQLEETLYWLSLLTDTNLPIVGVVSQRAHGELSNDGDRNIVDAVEYIVSKKGIGLGAVAVIDQLIFAARELKKCDDRPGNYKAIGGAGGILGSVKPSTVSIWYRPNYKHTSSSEVNISRLSENIEFVDRTFDERTASVRIKDGDGTLRAQAIPRVHIVKYGSFSQEDETENPYQEVDIMARIQKAEAEQKNEDEEIPKLHGFVYEALSPYAIGSLSQTRALWIAALSGMPVVRVGRSDPGGRVITNPDDLTIEGSNLDTTKARLLLMAAMLKLGRLPKAKDPINPTSTERQAVIEKVSEYQMIFESH